MPKTVILPHEFVDYLEQRMYSHFADAQQSIFPAEQPRRVLFEGSKDLLEGRLIYGSELLYLKRNHPSLTGISWGTFYDVYPTENPGNRPKGYIRIQPDWRRYLELQTTNFQLLHLTAGIEHAHRYGLNEFEEIDTAVDILADFVKAKIGKYEKMLKTEIETAKKETEKK